MKKNFLTIGLLALSFSAQSQITSNPKVLCHVDNDAKFYVGKGALVYNGGGLQVKGTGVWENRGNVMLVASDATNDVFRTWDGTADKAEGATTGGKFVNKLNEDAAYGSVNTTANPSVFTYGQLYISGFLQKNLVGIVDQEYRQTKHGDYQQIALPFFDKTLSTLSASSELNKTFTNQRWTKNEILKWNNASVLFDNVSVSSKIAAPGSGYYILGSLGLDTSSQVYTLRGRPFAEENVPDVALQNAGNGVNFGPTGGNINSYAEAYNTYLQDGFHIASGGTAWSQTPATGAGYGKNIYQFGNPFLTNLDLSKVSFDEAGSGSSPVSDGNNLTKIYGIRFEVSQVQFTPNLGGGSKGFKYVTFATSFANPPIFPGSATPSTPVGDVDYMVVRPMGTFVIKLKDNSVADALNFKTLRRFNYLPRAATTNYSVSAAKNSSSNSSTVKQLGVIGLDANGNEVGRTYYVVYPTATTGHSLNAQSQVTATSTDVVGTYEEALQGGYDTNYTSSYWLYINEANENDFLGKNIKLKKYSAAITSYKFEIRENAELVPDNTHLLSQGIGFYYKAPNGTVMEAKQGEVIPITSNTAYDLYYGAPNSSSLGTNDVLNPSRTMVVFDPSQNDHVVIFDPNWKLADVQVYDMSGKLVLSEKKIKTNRNFVIKLDSSTKNVYVVKIISSENEVVTAKIIK